MFNFTDEDKIRTLMLLKDKKSREDISNNLELGEGSVRTILDQLKEKGLLDSSKQGHILSAKGKKYVSKLLFSDFYKVKLKPFENFITYALVIKKHNEPNINFRLRDIAVRNGAEGAIIMYGDFKVEGHEFIELKKQIKANKKDIIIIVAAETKKVAQNSALLIAKEISKP